MQILKFESDFLRKVPECGTYRKNSLLMLVHYDLSGAQITNIARKATTHHVLYGTPIDVKLLEQLVEEETGYRKKAVGSIGFKRGKAAEGEGWPAESIPPQQGSSAA